jgi:transposase
VLCISSGRTEKDKAIREKQEKEYLADVSRLKKRVEGGRRSMKETAIYEAIGRLKERYPRVARYYLLTYDAGKKDLLCTVDKEKMRKAEFLDGSYILKTDRADLSADEIWRIYMTLTRAEAAFRAMKSPLSERPIFHQVERRVETHIFLCVLAYHLLVARGGTQRKPYDNELGRPLSMLCKTATDGYRTMKKLIFKQNLTSNSFIC